MTTKDEALEMAIEALNNACIKIEKWTKGGKWTAGKEALAKCKEALKHQEVGDAEIKQMLNDIEYYQKRVEELEQPLTRDWKETIDERIAKDDKFKEALAQPAQAITEGSQLSNIKAGSQSEKPSSPPAPKHTCTYSRTMNQEYPRKCIHCGEVEALAQPAQEPKCSEHPDAPHGFCRNASHSADRYVCECEGWEAEQPAQEPVYLYMDALDSARDVCKYLDHDMVDKAKAHTTFFWSDLDKIRDFDDTHPAPSWQGLSDEEKISIKRQINNAFNEGFEKGKAMSLVASIPPNFIKLEGMEKKKTHPSWQGLSDDEINKIYGEVQGNCIKDFPTELYAAWFEALKEKNTP